MKRYALTAIGRDRPGIVAAVTRVLFEHGCNIEDSSMTRLEDEFAIILIMSMPEGKPLDALKMDFKAVESSTGLTINLKEITKERVSREEPSNYIITLHGADKAGIVYKTADALARMGINITDLETKIIGDEKKIYILVMEIFSPKGMEIKKVEDELKTLGESLGVTIKLKPIEDYEPL